MEDNAVSKSELARRLGICKSYITQILSGSRNMTLGSLSDICFALGFKPKIKLPVQPLIIEETVSKYDELICDEVFVGRKLQHSRIRKIKQTSNVYEAEVSSWIPNNECEAA
jgi:transcriptional regulator with XRE-family HTH domain